MNELRSILPSVAILGVVAVIAVILTVNRGWDDVNRSRIRAAVHIALATVLCQAVHFGEELMTGFHERFPEMFGLEPISLPVFVSFNVGWLAIWSLCAWGLAARFRLALFPLWFLALACILNGVAHPLLSLLAGGYFPGLVTSPGVGVLGVVLMRRLLLVTRSAHLPQGAA